MLRAFALSIFGSLVFFSSSPGQTEQELATGTQKIFANYCTACHGPEAVEKGKVRGEVSYILDFARLVKEEYIVPKKPGESYLLDLLVDGQMPPGSRPKPTKDELTLVKKWIEAGAPVVKTTVVETPTKADPELAKKAWTILESNCKTCHGPKGSKQGGIDYILDTQRLIDNGKIIPGDPAKSRMLQLITTNKMPPPKKGRPKPTSDDVAVLTKWIENGAPIHEGGGPQPREFLTVTDQYSAMQAFLRKQPRADRKFYRFFDITHLHNNPQLEEQDLRVHRAALSKLINGLSWKRRIVVPRAIDDHGTLYSIDLRELDWDRADMWNEICRAYPFGLKYTSHEDEEFADLAADVYEMADTEFPCLRADWFVATASRPPLYDHLLFENLLGLPKHMTDRHLEKKLGVPVNDNIAKEKVARAGFARSGVSSHNRLIERHESPYGAYWKSYDFKTDKGRGNLFRYPLGPVYPGNPFEEQSFIHDGGEIIFNLPNGMQAYLLVDGKGNRIEKGPPDVVADTQMTTGTTLVVNGISCMACHKHGMISDFEDTVREGHSLQGRFLRKVHRLYAKKDAMAKLVKEDRDRFMTAMRQAVEPFYNPEKKSDWDLVSEDEPVLEVGRRYFAELTLDEAAFELGMKDPQMLKFAIRTNDALRRLGLRPLSAGNTIKREAWQAVEVFHSPYQKVSLELRKGTPAFLR